MITSNIDTFEHDISAEIKNKEATIGDIASATGEVGNDVAPINKIPPFLMVSVIILILSGMIAGGLFAYTYYSKKQSLTNQSKVTSSGGSLPIVPLGEISPTLEHALGRFLGNAQHSDYGYSLTITSYSPVYSFMIRNESSYADEIASAVGSARDTSTTTPPFTFTDLTTNNQNMRVGNSASSTVVYAFVNNTQTLLLSSTTEGILSLRSAILH